MESEHTGTKVRSARWTAYLVAILGTLAVFARGIPGALVYDDLLFVRGNPLIVSLANVPEMFSSAYFDVFAGAGGSSTGYWRPLTSLVMALAYEVNGSQPEAFHCASIALHLGATAVVVRLSMRLGLHAMAAAMVGLIFGVHPVHVESVTWISAIGDPLFGVLALLSIDAFVGWRRKGSLGWPILPAVFLALALLAKELAVAALPILVAMDLLRPRIASEGDRQRALVRAYGPFVLVCVAYWAARVWVFGDVDAGFDRTTTEFAVGNARTGQLLAELVGGSFALLVWPGELGLFHAMKPELSMLDPGFLLDAGLALVLLVASVRLWKARMRLELAALLLIPCGILPVLMRARALGPFPLAERFLYLSVLGYSLLLVLALGRALPARGAVALLGLVAVALGARTFVRVGEWNSEVALFRSAVRVEPRSPYVRWGLGRAALTLYRETHDAASLQEAHDAFDVASKLVLAANSGDASIYATEHDWLQARLGVAWCELNGAEAESLQERASALEQFRSIANENPNSPSAFTGLGAALYMADRITEATSAYERAISLDSRAAVAQYGLGRLFEDRNELARAEAHYRLAHAERPDSVKDILALARVAVSQGAVSDGLALATQARGLDRTNPEPDYIEGIAAALDGRMPEALDLFTRSIELGPEFGSAHLQRANVLAALGRRDEAIESFVIAATLLPNRFDPHYNLGALLLAEGRSEQARPYLVHAYELATDPVLRSAVREALEPLYAGDSVTWLRLALHDARADNLAGCEAWLRQVLAHDRDHVDAALLCARVLDRMDRSAEGIALLEDVLDRNPTWTRVAVALEDLRTGRAGQTH